MIAVRTPVLGLKIGFDSKMSITEKENASTIEDSSNAKGMKKSLGISEKTQLTQNIP